MLRDAGMVTVDIALSKLQAATHLAVAGSKAGAAAFFPAVVGTGVLQAFDLQMAPDLGGDLFGFDGSALELGVTA